MKQILNCLLFYFFSMQGFAQLENGNVYQIISSVDAGKVLGGGNNSSGHPKIVCLHAVIAENNYWKVETVRGGFFKLKNEGTGKYMALSVGATTAGVSIVMSEDLGQLDIQWTVSYSGPNKFNYDYKFINRKSGLYLAVEGGSTAVGATAVQWPNQGQPDVTWKIKKEVRIILTEDLPGTSPIPKSLWQRYLNSALENFAININNYTPVALSEYNNPVFQFLKRNDCLFRFGASEAKFGVVAPRIAPATIYFININSMSATIDNSNDQFRIDLLYQAGARQILANCIDDINCNGGMWWINLSSYRISITFRPEMINGKISYTTVAISERGRIASVRENSIVQNYQSQDLLRKISDGVKSALETAVIKEIFSTGFTRGYIQGVLRDNPSSTSNTGILPYKTIAIRADGSLQFGF